jgi:hypothetical protein
LYPGVPNTTAVSQETDRNYGPFKTQFRKNLDEVIDVRIKGNHSTSIAPHLVGLTTFGGIDPTSGHEVRISAFEKGFSKEACLSAETGRGGDSSGEERCAYKEAVQCDEHH